MLFFTGGGGLYVFPVFIASLQEEFGWSMTQISISAALFGITMGLSNPLVGNLFGRFGARKTMLIAATVSVLTLLAYAGLQNLWMLYAIALFSGFAVAGTTILPAQTLVINWFDQFRGRAMGLTMLGIGAGGFLLPPFNEFMIRLVGWRLAWVVAAVMLVGIVVPLIVIFVRTWPSELGLLVDGANAGDLSDSASAPPVTGLSVKSAVATSTFWLLLTIFLLQLIGVSAMNFHFVPFATHQRGRGEVPVSRKAKRTTAWFAILRTPGTDHNQLAVARATAVYQYLVARGQIPANRMIIVGHGANNPVVSNATAAGKARNSRVELVVYPEKVAGR